MKVGIVKGEVIYGRCRRGIVGLFPNPHSENYLKCELPKEDTRVGIL